MSPTAEHPTGSNAGTRRDRYMAALEAVDRASRRRLVTQTHATYMELSRAHYAVDHARWEMENRRGEP